MSDDWAKRMLGTMSEKELAVASGYCVPDTVLYDVIVPQDSVITFPKISVQRGGISYDPPSPAERLAADALRARIARLTDSIVTQQRALIDAACVEALANGWDVNIYRQGYRFTRDGDTYNAMRSLLVGIGFTEAKYSLPTVIEHLDHDVAWTDDDEWC